MKEPPQTPAEQAPAPRAPIPRAANARRVVLVAGAVLLTLWLGATIGPPIGAGLHSAWTALRGEDAQHGGETRYFTCGMHPWVILPRPGSCPICGMDLVPLDPAKFSGEVTINPVVAQNIGVRVQKVEKSTAGGAVRTVGIVAYDETRLGDVNLKVSGWIEKLKVDFLGERVRKGQALFTLYSPELYAAQEEYLLAWRQAQAAGPAQASGRQLLESARTKLSYFDIGATQIAALEKSGTPAKTMTIYSPQAGVVTEKHVFEGMKVMAGTTAYRIADLSRVWVMATLYEYQSQKVKVGQEATMSLSYLPGTQLTGKVVYVYPYLDARTRQITVRLEFPNPDLALKPGMYATVQLLGATDIERVLVPRAAIIDTGERQVAFVSQGEGHFEPRAVRMGGEAADGKVEVLEGLQPGELVVTSGQFLIDSEARMRESLAKMIRGTPPGEQPAAAEMAMSAAPTVALPPAAAAALGAGLDGYLAAQGALAADSTRDIGVSARKLAESMEVMVAIDVPGQPQFWRQHPQATAVREGALALAAAPTIDEARQAFNPLSTALAQLVNAVGVPASYGRKLEQQHCPMYPSGSEGAVWLQPAGPVRNPYFGKTMLTCSDARKPVPVAPGGGAAPSTPGTDDVH